MLILTVDLFVLYCSFFYLLIAIIRTITKPIINIVIAIIAEIQSGERTQIQDQFITPISFNTIKATVNNPANPIPLLLELTVLIILNKP